MQLAELHDHILLPSPEELERERLWIGERIEKIGAEKLTELIQSAVDVRLNAYPPPFRLHGGSFHIKHIRHHLCFVQC